MHGLNWQDFGARWLDNARMQWTSMDPLAEKYYSISPYAYCMNNPVRNVDPDGKEIQLPGDRKAQDAYVQMLHNSTGNNYSIAKNKLSYEGVDADFSENKSEILTNTIQKGIDAKDVYTLSLVGTESDDKGVFIDRYKDNKIDVSDLKSLGDASSALQGAAIGHFLNEVQDPSNDFNTAHKASLGVEGKIYGELIGDKTITTRTDYATGAARNGYQTVIYQYNATNKFELQQGAKSTITTANILNGVKVPFPVNTVTTTLTGELNSVKKLP